MGKDYCIVVGGVNVDIGGFPDAPLILGDSNPGRIFTSLGGVGRNIAHNMRLLGLDVKMVTALGEDEHGNLIKKSCEELGIDISGYCSCPNDATSSYMFIANRNGDMNVAVSDMAIYKKVTPDYLETRMDDINSAKIVVIDTNIPTESIAYLTKNCKVPVLADPVSCTKAARLLPSLSNIFAITPNALETRILTGIVPDTEEDMQKAAEIFLGMGVKNVFISLGENGLFAANSDMSIHLKNLPGKLVNATGAGDAMMAGFAYGFMKGKSFKEVATIGISAASIAIEGEDTINNNLSIEEVLKRTEL